MIFSLSWKNFKGQFLNYFVYFISMAFAVIVYYCFSAITYNRALVKRVGQEIHINGAMNFGGILLIIMVLGFMLAANHFFLLKRKREIDLYHLFGMRKSQISLLFFMETLIIGAASLVIGIIFGVIFSKLFSMILAKAMFLKVESLFSISFPSMMQTAMIFAFMLLIVSFRSTWIIYRYRVTSLAKNVDERIIESKKLSKLTIFLAVLGILLILTGYLLSYYVIPFAVSLSKALGNFFGFLLAPLLIMLICMLGTYLFFKYTIYLIVYLIEKNRSSYYRNLHMLALGNTKFHIKKSGRTLSTITIFIAVALGMIGGSASLYTLGMNSVKVTAPTDFIVSEESANLLREKIEAEPNTVIDSSVTLKFKLTGSRFHFKIGQQQKESSLSPVNLLALSNYREYQRINPYLKDIEIDRNQEAVNLDSIQNILSGFVRYDSVFDLQGGEQLTVKETKPDYLGQNLMRYTMPTLVVSDELYQRINTGLTYKVTAINVQTSDEEALTNFLAESIKPNWSSPIYYRYQWVNNQVSGYTEKTSQVKEEERRPTETDEEEFWQLNYTNHFSDLRYERRVMGLFIYVAMFLGILALIITGSILMLQQFAEAEQEKAKYDLLRKIGVSKKQIIWLVYQQNSIIFFPPMLIGVLHATFAIYVFSSFVSSSGYWLAYLSCGMLILIYLAYYFLTSAIYTRIIHGREQH
ncbi:FtsX-like permease family protein [Erwinia sp. CPCC 100877]|nr:FtsX-like permease family protein [Erwinia sp. CPCC 100877]